MINAIIGAKGEMAQNLLLPLLKQLGPVFQADKGSGSKDIAKIWEADVIWLAIPRDTVDSILKDVRLDSKKLIVDICSIKRRLSVVVKATGADFLSLHPLHGPYVPLNGQKWAIIKNDKTSAENQNAKIILEFLKQQGVSFIEAQSEDEHDFMMGVTLSIPEFFTIFIDELINKYSKENNQEKPDMSKIMEWAVPASNAFFSSYVHSINSSAAWLREDLVLGAYGRLIESVQKTAEDFSKISAIDIEKKLAEQKKFVENLPLEERKRIRQWIEEWFVDSTQKIFVFHKKKSVKPRLKIQFTVYNIKEIFPVGEEGREGKISVGIHGIEGCFTHESALRLCEDLGINSSKIDFKYLIDAKGVVGAVDRGEIDRGVFCIANSGSGAYIESMKIMGEYNFDVLALYGMEIMQCLMARAEVKDISEIKEVFAHPQAISQCERTFAEKYQNIKLTKGTDADDTALCAKRIANNGFPKETATLASQIAAKLYGLNILEYGMHHDPFNTTTFLVVKKKTVLTKNSVK